MKRMIVALSFLLVAGALLAGQSGVTLKILFYSPELTTQYNDMTKAYQAATGTTLDITLRNLGIKTVVATGVSVNLGVFGLCVEAVNLGYRVILPRDCVAGFPADYADLVIKNSLAQLCTLTTSEAVAAAWA